MVHAAVVGLFVLVWIGGSDTSGRLGQGIAGLMILVPIYFFPSLVAKSRQRSKRQAIFVLTLLTGWTVFGWVAVMAWAFTEGNAIT